MWLDALSDGESKQGSVCRSLSAFSLHLREPQKGTRYSAKWPEVTVERQGRRIVLYTSLLVRYSFCRTVAADFVHRVPSKRCVSAVDHR
jgi:hypothetical protein